MAKKTIAWVFGCAGLLVCFKLPAGAQTEADAPGVDPWALIGQPVKLPENGPDKSAYSLFNPVPGDQLRAFSTDRPGKTHSSLTVDAGHFQVESDFANYTYDHYSPNQQTTRIISVATPILKAGITNSVDVEAAFDFYNATHVTNRANAAGANGVSPGGAGGSSGMSAASVVGGSNGAGFGDIALGSKINIFGNDGGAQSFAVLPFIKLPTAAHNVGNGVVEYTVNAPYTINLDTLWALTLEPALGYLKNTSNTGHHGDYSFLVNLNRPVFLKTVTAAVEFSSEYSSDRSVTPRYTFDPSLQWLVTPVLQLDIGAYIGLNRAAPDYNPYIGVSYRY